MARPSRQEHTICCASVLLVAPWSPIPSAGGLAAHVGGTPLSLFVGLGVLAAAVGLLLYRSSRDKRMLRARDEALSQARQELARLSEQLDSAQQRLEESDAARTDFISNVSHELRTPMTAIKGYVDNMLDGITGDVNEKQARYLTRMKRNADRLTRLINDLLDLSRTGRAS